MLEYFVVKYVYVQVPRVIDGEPMNPTFPQEINRMSRIMAAAASSIVVKMRKHIVQPYMSL